MQTQLGIFFLNINIKNHIKCSPARQDTDMKNSMHEHFRWHDFMLRYITLHVRIGTVSVVLI